jgi:hypothetical protein
MMNDELGLLIADIAQMKKAATSQSGPELYRMTSRDKTLMRDLRYVMRENQTQFWKRFGVAQSSGSRFERGVAMPLPLLLLIRLYCLRCIDDADLQFVRSSDYENGLPDKAPCSAPPGATKTALIRA